MAYAFKHGDRPLEGYTIQRGIGRGGFGEVYYAISDGGREVALKYLRDNAEVELRGVSQCMNLKSPHLVTIFDVKKNADGEYFIIMEHVCGPSLRELLMAEPRGLGVEKATFLLREIAKGLAYLHDRGIVHRDMKPANIFYEDGHVKIGDYGLSKFISVSRHSAQTSSVGTVHYMAPEVGSGNYHRGIDVYALGVMVYEMLLGRVPFEGSSMGEVLMKHLTEQPEVDELPPPFGQVIRKALAKDPRDRYQNVNEMIDAVLEVGSVRDSLAGFNPSTLSMGPRREFPEGAPTPIPSPNPPRPAAAPRAAAWGGFRIGRARAGVHERLGEKLEKRLHRVSDKIEQRMDQLAGRQPHRRARRSVAMAAWQGPTRAPQRIILASFVTLAWGLLCGLVAGLMSEMEEVGASTGMMVVAIPLGLRLTNRVRLWLDDAAQPEWVQRLLQIGCCAPFMLLANIPVFAKYEELGLGILLPLVGVIVFADWRARFLSGARGEMSVGSAFSLGLFGLILGAMGASIAGVRDNEPFLIMGAIVGAAVSFAVQAQSWFVPLKEMFANDGEGPPPPEPQPKAAQELRPAPASVAAAVAAATAAATAAARAEAALHKRLDSSRARSDRSEVPIHRSPRDRRHRSGFARAFWSVVTFLMLSGALINTTFAAIMGGEMEETQLLAHLFGAIGSFSLMLFALQKVTLRKRLGFWRETACPFLIAVCLCGVGFSIVRLMVQQSEGPQLAACLSGIVLSGLMLLLLTWSRFRRSSGNAPAGAAAPVAGLGTFVVGAEGRPQIGAAPASGGTPSPQGTGIEGA